MHISNTHARNKALTLVVAVSIGLHLIALVIFGTYKIVDNITREERTFEAPEIIEVPQQEPEYVVNLEQRNQASAPPRPNPIVVDTPDISIPALNINVNIANSSSYGRGTGGFGTGSGLTEMRQMAVNLTDFGYSSFVKGTLEGTLFDTKRNPKGKPIVDMSQVDLSAVNNWLTPRMEEIIHDFTSGSWNINQLERKYLSSKQKLYASYFYIPLGSAQKAPEAFNASDEIEAVSIIALYSGEFTPAETGSFRFVGKADDAIIVQANNKIVFDGSLSNKYSELNYDEFDKGPKLMNLETRTGEWMNWKEGNPVKLDVLIAEAPGGKFYACLFYQKKGEDQVRIFSTNSLTEEESSRLRKMHPDLAARL